MIVRHPSAAVRITLLCILSIALPVINAMAQPAGLSAGAAAGASGTIVTIPVGFDPGSTDVHTLQFDLLFAPSLSYVSASTGSAATEAGKTVSVNALAGRVRVLVFGLNENAISSGVLTDVELDISASAPAGLIPVVVTGIVASDRYANPVLTFATAGGITVLPKAGAVAPMISDIAVSDITSKSASISWMTNRPANSVVEYWTGDSDLRVVALSALATGHSLGLNQLQKRTAYRFRIRSTDSEGNQAVTGEFNFQTTEDGAPPLVLPRTLLEQNYQSPDVETFIGMGLANLDVERTEVTFTAVESDGSPIAGRDVVNPRVFELNPKMQLGIVDLEVFGEGLFSSDPNGWIKLESASTDVCGFFLTFDSEMSFMDGANFSDGRMRNFAFTEVQPDGGNKINIVNSNPEDAAVTLELVNANGTVRSSRSRIILKNGALAADLFDDLFAGIEPDASDYVRASAAKGMQPFQILQQAQGDISALAGQDLTTGGTTLYSPQYVLGGPYRTHLSVLNLDSREGTVQFRFVSEEGYQIGATQYLSIPANGKAYIDDQSFFLEHNAESMVTGYVEILSDGIRLAGSTAFGDINGETFSAALALVSSLQKSVIFSHVASDDLYFTGIAILNPNTSQATATLELYAADGTLIETVSEFIPAGQRKARLLFQYFSHLARNDQISGYVRLISDKPVASFSLFGTHNLSILSAIPPQAVQ